MGRAWSRALLVVPLVSLAAVGCGLLLDVGALRGDAGPADATVSDAPSDGDAALDAPRTRPLCYLGVVRVGDAEPQTIPMVVYPDTDAAPTAIGCAAPMSVPIYSQSISRSGNYVLGRGYPPTLALNRAHYASTAQVPPGDSLLVFNTGMGATGSILAVDETSRCGSPPRRIEPFDAGLFAFQFPRFRRDGKRVAYIGLRSPSDPRGIYTVATDGVERPRLLYESATVNFVPPAWIDGAQPKVLWVDAPGTVYAQVDGPGVKEIATDCADAVGQVEYLDKAPYQRLVLEIQDRLYWLDYGADCSARTALVSADPPSVVQQDFAISPDVATIAYVSNRGEVADSSVPHTHVWLVGSAGGAPSPCGSPSTQYDDVGPRWYAGGAQLVWTRIARPGATEPSAIVMADVQGTNCANVRVVTSATTSGNTVHLVQGSSNAGCSVASGGSSAGAWWSALALACLRRRRRTARAS